MQTSSNADENIWRCQTTIVADSVIELDEIVCRILAFSALLHCFSAFFQPLIRITNVQVCPRGGESCSFNPNVGELGGQKHSMDRIRTV